MAEKDKTAEEQRGPSDADPIMLPPDDPQVLTFIKDRKLKYKVIDENGDEHEEELEMEKQE